MNNYDQKRFDGVMTVESHTVSESSSPTPEQIDHDIIGELSRLRQKIADLETAKGFHMACIENLVERLKDVERTVSSLELNRLRGNG